MRPDGGERFSRSSRGRLTTHDLGRFPDDTLFHRIGRAVCGAGCLPRKELFESWEMARRVRRLFRGGRIVDVAGGHGLLAQMMLLLDGSSPEAVVVDTAIPASAVKLHEALAAAWPLLSGRVAFVDRSLQEFAFEAGDVVVSSHACGDLTDAVLERATAVQARVAVLPCCHEVTAALSGDAGAIAGWVDGALAVDVMRAVRLQRQGYRVWTQTIPAAITPKNRLLLGAPPR